MVRSTHLWGEELTSQKNQKIGKKIRPTDLTYLSYTRVIHLLILKLPIEP